jgi:hypothetical protein
MATQPGIQGGQGTSPFQIQPFQPQQGRQGPQQFQQQFGQQQGFQQFQGQPSQRQQQGVGGARQARFQGGFGQQGGGFGGFGNNVRIGGQPNQIIDLFRNLIQNPQQQQGQQQQQQQANPFQQQAQQQQQQGQFAFQPQQVPQFGQQQQAPAPSRAGGFGQSGQFFEPQQAQQADPQQEMFQQFQQFLAQQQAPQQTLPPAPAQQNIGTSVAGAPGFDSNAFAQQFGQQQQSQPEAQANPFADQGGTLEQFGGQIAALGQQERAAGGGAAQSFGGQSLTASVQPGTQLNFDTQRDFGFEDAPLTTYVDANGVEGIDIRPIAAPVADFVRQVFFASERMFDDTDRLAIETEMNGFVADVLFPALSGNGGVLPDGSTAQTTGDVVRAIANHAQSTIARLNDGQFMLVFEQPQGGGAGAFNVLNLLDTPGTNGPLPVNPSVMDDEARTVYPDISDEELRTWRAVFADRGFDAARRAVQSMRNANPTAGAGATGGDNIFGPNTGGLIGGGGTDPGALVGNDTTDAARRASIRGILGQNIQNLDLQQFGTPRDTALFDESLGNLRGDITQQGSLANMQNLTTPTTPGAFSQLTQGQQLDPATNEVVPGQLEQLFQQFFGSANQSGQLGQDLGAAGLGSSALDFLTGAPGGTRELTLEEAGRVADVFAEQGEVAALALEAQLSQVRGQSIFDRGQGTLSQAFSVDPTLTGGLGPVAAAGGNQSTSIADINERVAAFRGRQDEQATAAHEAAVAAAEAAGEPPPAPPELLGTRGLPATSTLAIQSAENQLGRQLSQQELNSVVQLARSQPDATQQNAAVQRALESLTGTPLDTPVSSDDLFGSTFATGDSSQAATGLQQALQRGATATGGAPSTQFQQLTGAGERTEPVTEIERQAVLDLIESGDPGGAQRLAEFFATRSGATLDTQNLRNIGQAGAAGTAAVDVTIDEQTQADTTVQQVNTALEEAGLPALSNVNVSGAVIAAERDLGRSLNQQEMNQLVSLVGTADRRGQTPAQAVTPFLQNLGAGLPGAAVDKARDTLGTQIEALGAEGSAPSVDGQTLGGTDLLSQQFGGSTLQDLLGGAQNVFNQQNLDTSINAGALDNSRFGVLLGSREGQQGLGQELSGNIRQLAGGTRAPTIQANTLGNSFLGAQLGHQTGQPGLAGDLAASAGNIAGGSVGAGQRGGTQFGVSLGPTELGTGLAQQAQSAARGITGVSAGVGQAPTEAFGQDIGSAAQAAADANAAQGNFNTQNSNFFRNLSQTGITQVQQELIAQALGQQTQAGERAENALFQDVESQIQRINSADPFQAGDRGISGSGVAAGLLGEQAGGLLQGVGNQVAQQRFAAQQQALQQIPQMSAQFSQQQGQQQALQQQAQQAQAAGAAGLFGQLAGSADAQAQRQATAGGLEAQLGLQAQQGQAAALQGLLGQLGGFQSEDLQRQLGASQATQQLGLQGQIGQAQAQQGAFGALTGAAQNQSAQQLQADIARGQLGQQGQIAGIDAQQNLFGQVGGLVTGEAERDLQAQIAQGNLGLGRAQAQSQGRQNLFGEVLGAAGQEAGFGQSAANLEAQLGQQQQGQQLSSQQDLFNTLFGAQQGAQQQNRALEAQAQGGAAAQDFQRQQANAQLGLQQQAQQFGQQFQGTQGALQGGLQTAQLGDAAGFQREQQGFQERFSSQQALLGQQAQQASLNTQRAIAQGDLQTARTQLGQQAQQFQQGMVQQSELQAQQLQEQARQFGLQGRADLQQQAIDASLQMSSLAQQGRQFVEQANQQQTNIARDQIAQFSSEFQRQDITADTFTEQVRSGRFSEQMSAMQFMFQQASTREGLSQQARSQVQGAIQALGNFELGVQSAIQNQQLVDTQVAGPSTLDNILAVGNTLASVAGAFIPG